VTEPGNILDLHLTPPVRRGLEEATGDEEEVSSAERLFVTF